MSDEWIATVYYNRIVCDDCQAFDACDYADKGKTTYCPVDFYEKYRKPAMKKELLEAIEKELNERE